MGGGRKLGVWGKGCDRRGKGIGTGPRNRSAAFESIGERSLWFKGYPNTKGKLNSVLQKAWCMYSTRLGFNGAVDRQTHRLSRKMGRGGINHLNSTKSEILREREKGGWAPEGAGFCDGQSKHRVPCPLASTRTG